MSRKHNTPVELKESSRSIRRSVELESLIVVALFAIGAFSLPVSVWFQLQQSNLGVSNLIETNDSGTNSSASEAIEDQFSDQRAPAVEGSPQFPGAHLELNCDEDTNLVTRRDADRTDFVGSDERGSSTVNTAFYLVKKADMANCT